MLPLFILNYTVVLCLAQSDHKKQSPWTRTRVSFKVNIKKPLGKVIMATGEQHCMHGAYLELYHTRLYCWKDTCSNHISCPVDTHQVMSSDNCGLALSCPQIGSVLTDKLTYLPVWSKPQLMARSIKEPHRLDRNYSIHIYIHTHAYIF